MIAVRPLLFFALPVCVVFQLGCHSVARTDERRAPADGSVVATLELANPSNFPRNDEPVYLSFYELGIEPEKGLLFWLDEVSLPTQYVDLDADGNMDGLFTLVNFASGEIQRITVKPANDKAPRTNKRTQAEISIKRDGHWVPRADGSVFKNYEDGHFVNVDAVTVPDYYTDHSNWIRYEGPGIESDLVGYRIYLDGRNGFDIFGKSVATPVLQQVGLDGYESYHHPQPWGMDILKVGDSLGAGGFGYWDGKHIVHLQNVGDRTAQIRQNGDLFSSFSIDYKNWQVADLTLDARALISMHAGSRLVKNEITLDGEIPNLAIGIVAHPDTQLMIGPQDIPGDAFTYVASWGPQSLDGQNLGMAVFFRRGDSAKIFADGSSHIVAMNPAGGAVTYYFAATWQGELGDGIGNVAAFQSYLTEQTERLTRPLRRRLFTRVGEAAKHELLAQGEPLQWSAKMADAELARKTLDYRFDGWDAHRKRKPKFEYDIVGLLPYAYHELAEATGSTAYREVKATVTASYVTQDGAIRQYDKNNFNIDAVAPGRALLQLYRETPDPKYATALATLRDQLRHHPKTRNGAFWHKQIYPGQIWLDGVYMGMPFLAEYAKVFESGAQQANTFDQVVHEFEVTRDLLRDPDTGLYFHAWDENRQQNWANKSSGLSANIWGRGNGWLAMALVDTLDYLPPQHAGRNTLIDMTVELARSLARYQDSSGTWWQIMDKPTALGNYRESTASAMFTYFLAKATNRGYLSESNMGGELTELISRAYEGLITEFVVVHPDGRISMTNQCHVAGLGFGRDGSYDYYMNEAIVANDPKGTGPFILAGIEFNQFLKNFQVEQHD